MDEAVTLGKAKPAPKEAMVNNDNAGVFHTTASGAVSFKVRATNANSEANFDEAQVMSIYYDNVMFHTRLWQIKGLKAKQVTIFFVLKV